MKTALYAVKSALLKSTVAMLILGCVAATPLLAASMDTTPIENSVNENFAIGKKAVDAKNWKAAIDAFEKVVAKDAKNADAHNYLGYSNRQLNKMDASFKHYREALRLNPQHRGAHEYIGQAYLKVGDLPKAQEHLAALKGICGVGCEEYKDLDAAIASYRPPAK